MRTVTVRRAGHEVLSGVEIKQDAETTGGALAVFELVQQPGETSIRHAHTRETEVIVVVAGALSMRLDDGDHHLATGDSISIPAGTTHQFSNAGDVPCRLLLCAAPAGVEQFFRDLDRDVPEAEAASRVGLLIC